MIEIGPVTLEGRHVRLAPLSPDHAPALAEVVRGSGLPDLWYTAVPGPDEMDREIARRLALQAEGSMIPFTVCRPDGAPVGMTTYMRIDRPNHRVEIGSTWLGPEVQRSGVNTEMKRLMLAHAFETVGVNAVEFRTHFMNRQSRAAIERLGAKLDGILRAHVILPNGTVRDTAVYSILAAEWPSVRAHLDAALARFG